MQTYTQKRPPPSHHTPFETLQFCVFLGARGDSAFLDFSSNYMPSFENIPTGLKNKYCNDPPPPPPPTLMRMGLLFVNELLSKSLKQNVKMFRNAPIHIFHLAFTSDKRHIIIVAFLCSIDMRSNMFTFSIYVFSVL